MIFNIRDFGAIGNGTTKDTGAIQAAADACRENGGGTILIPTGDYLTASVRLYSNTVVHLQPGARLMLSGDEEDYEKLRGKYDTPFTRDAALLLGLPAWTELNFMQKMFLAGRRNNTDNMFFARDAENIVIEGDGMLDGQYHLFFNSEAGGEDGKYAAVFSKTAPRWLRRLDEGCLLPKTFRPQMIVIHSCRNVIVRGLKIYNGPLFNLRIIDSELVRCESLDIETNIRCQNTDGINLSGCRNSFIRDCRIVTGDDCIALSCGEAMDQYNSCENIVVSDCIGRTYCNFLRIFQGIDADMCVEEGISPPEILDNSRRLYVKNIQVSNCILEQGGCFTNIVSVLGLIEDVHFSNIRACQPGKDAVIFIAIQKEGKIRDISFDGVYAKARGAITVQGTDQNSIQRIRFRDCCFEVEPKSKLFGNGLIDPLIRYWISDLAPYNIYIRHASDVRLVDCNLRWGKADIDDIFEMADPAARPEEYNALWRADMDPTDSWPCINAYDVDGLVLRDFKGSGFGNCEAVRTEKVTRYSFELMDA